MKRLRNLPAGKKKEFEMNQREILKMIENLSHKIDTLSDRVPGNTISETNENNTENMASTSRSSESNELTHVGGHYIVTEVIVLHDTPTRW